ncbi:MAG: hypothetical protein EAZ98_20085 [Oscillatoriales cyanobacterium]|uniref:Uncharacterized protein n=1 Tax=Microcoleus anatoxicus PTRS2 TaxID=2705321 RepID=A0ABU8YPE1_9CYAN|nr:MAG: hypothetical protein EA000_22885 [Oscillatoriales cyanobacterium]TAD94223.1 MAG: hypothetical protein EAZ98_20085 [Oscillatoriales cyanobacterium]TAE00661.1 MAG: hypothetical protein EAZ96_20765 [Oscillatoriales cyanobacterium]
MEGRRGKTLSALQREDTSGGCFWSASFDPHLILSLLKKSIIEQELLALNFQFPHESSNRSSNGNSNGSNRSSNGSNKNCELKIDW